MSIYLVVDFGGGSGWIMVGIFIEGKLKLEEVYCFVNWQIKFGNCVYWDFFFFFEEMKNGFCVVVWKGYEVKSMVIDIWGVDFGLIDKDGKLLGNLVCYCDFCMDGIFERVFKQIDQIVYYVEIGIQVMFINILF